MARIAVAYEALERGQFPPVCCRTGVHTDTYVRWRFTEVPTWTWVLLPFGILPFVIARLFTTKRFDGVLPMAPNVAARLRRLHSFSAVAGLVAVAAVATVIVSVEVAVAGFVLAGIAGISLLAAWFGSPDAHRDVERGSVEIRNVHRRFVETIEAAWAQGAHTT